MRDAKVCDSLPKNARCYDQFRAGTVLSTFGSKTADGAMMDLMFHGFDVLSIIGDNGVDSNEWADDAAEIVYGGILRRWLT